MVLDPLPGIGASGDDGEAFGGRTFQRCPHQPTTDPPASKLLGHSRVNEDQPVAVAPVDQLRLGAVLLDDEPALARVITDEGAPGISHGSDGNTWRISLPRKW